MYIIYYLWNISFILHTILKQTFLYWYISRRSKNEERINRTCNSDIKHLSVNHFKRHLFSFLGRFIIYFFIRISLSRNSQICILLTFIDCSNNNQIVVIWQLLSCRHTKLLLNVHLLSRSSRLSLEFLYGNNCRSM